MTAVRAAARPSDVDPTDLATSYNPDLDGEADPGEIVWTWVPYEELDGRGKDRPLLVVGRAGRVLHALMLSSNADHARHDDWVSVGEGPWDAEGRESWVRLDRVLELDADGIRREACALGREPFERVAAALRAGHGWR